MMGMALGNGNSRFILEPAYTVAVGQGGSFCQLPTEATPVATSATKTLLH